MELQRFARWLAPLAVVGVHDTGPQHVTYELLKPLIRKGMLTALTLRTPRGVTFGQVREG
jgi:hypothetical protein